MAGSFERGFSRSFSKNFPDVLNTFIRHVDEKRRLRIMEDNYKEQWKNQKQQNIISMINATAYQRNIQSQMDARKPKTEIKTFGDHYVVTEPGGLPQSFRYEGKSDTGDPLMKFPEGHPIIKQYGLDPTRGYTEKEIDAYREAYGEQTDRDKEIRIGNTPPYIPPYQPKQETKTIGGEEVRFTYGKQGDVTNRVVLGKSKARPANIASISGKLAGAYDNYENIGKGGFLAGADEQPEWKSRTKLLLDQGLTTVGLSEDHDTVKGLKSIFEGLTKEQRDNLTPEKKAGIYRTAIFQMRDDGIINQQEQTILIHWAKIKPIFDEIEK